MLQKYNELLNYLPIAMNENRFIYFLLIVLGIITFLTIVLSLISISSTILKYFSK